jgi:hypothetical protein
MSELAPFIKPLRFDQAVLSRRELARSIGQVMAQITELHADDDAYVTAARNALLTIVESWGLDLEQVNVGERREAMKIRLRKAGTNGKARR